VLQYSWISHLVQLRSGFPPAVSEAPQRPHPNTVNFGGVSVVPFGAESGAVEFGAEEYDDAAGAIFEGC
jgi:hypothetical protein